MLTDDTLIHKILSRNYNHINNHIKIDDKIINDEILMYYTDVRSI
jgi:hypothetical protein